MSRPPKRAIDQFLQELDSGAIPRTPGTEAIAKSVRKRRGAPTLTVRKRNERYLHIVSFIWREILAAEARGLSYPKARSAALEAAAEKFGDLRTMQRRWKPFDVHVPVWKLPQVDRDRLARIADQALADFQRRVTTTK